MIKARTPKSGELHTQELIWALLFHEIARVQRYAMPLSLLRLKTASPQSSRLQGADGVKKIVSQCLQNNLRQVDMSGSYQNDYLIVLPVTDEAAALIVAQRLITTLYNVHPYRYGKTLEITPFIGIATLHPNAPIPIETFVDQATMALKEAFRRSPGAVVTYGDLLPDPEAATAPLAVTPAAQPAPNTPTPQ
jgi:hypothetical protein